MAIYQPLLRAKSIAQRAIHAATLLMIVIITQWHAPLATTLLPFPLSTIHLSAGSGSLQCPRGAVLFSMAQPEHGQH